MNPALPQSSPNGLLSSPHHLLKSTSHSFGDVQKNSWLSYFNIFNLFTSTKKETHVTFFLQTRTHSQLWVSVSFGNYFFDLIHRWYAFLRIQTLWVINYPSNSINALKIKSFGCENKVQALRSISYWFIKIIFWSMIRTLPTGSIPKWLRESVELHPVLWTRTFRVEFCWNIEKKYRIQPDFSDLSTYF